MVAGLDLADEGVPAGFEGGGDGIHGFEKRRLVLVWGVRIVGQLDAESVALVGGLESAHHGAQAADESARGAADVFLVVKVSPGANVRFRHGPTGAVTDGDAVELGGIVSLVAVAHVEDVLFEDGLLAVGSGFGLRDVEGDGLGELGLDGGEDPFLELREEAPSLGVLGLELARLGAGDAGGLLEEIFREHAAIVRDVVHGEPGADGRARGEGD